MKTNNKTTFGKRTTALQSSWTIAQRFALAAICGLLLVGSSLAQEPRPEPRRAPEPLTAEAKATEKPPDPNESLTPAPLANQVVDGDIVFTSPAQFTYPRDIRLSDNFGGLRFYGSRRCDLRDHSRQVTRPGLRCRRGCLWERICL